MPGKKETETGSSVKEGEIRRVSDDPVLTAEGITGPLDDVRVQARILGGHAAERDYSGIGEPNSIGGK